jgi:rSAM/selenodomain-associated transferase 1
MNNEQALIIFARKPEAGKVKTRLAATIGNGRALDIYIKLLAHTKATAAHVKCDNYVFLTEVEPNDFWGDFKIEIQEGETLGERMHNAFKLVFCKGYKGVVIIGSDCPYLTPAILQEGFDKLLIHDVVIGPTVDGGYYLLGMDKLYPKLFENKTWSTQLVYKQTINDLDVHQLSNYVLPTLIDVDEEKDIPAGWLINP